MNIEEGARKLLEGKNFAFVATIMKDGSPQVSPTWVDVDGDMILINTAHGRVKQNNIDRDPRVAISLVNSENPYEMLTVRGKVVEQKEDEAPDHIDKMAKKYLDLDKYPFAQPGEKRVLWVVEPTNVFYMAPRE